MIDAAAEIIIYVRHMPPPMLAEDYYADAADLLLPRRCHYDAPRF